MPPSYSQALMAPRGILSGANAAIIGQRPMGYLTTGTLGLPLTGEGQAGRPVKQARTQMGAGAASGSGAASSSSRPQMLGRRVDPSTSVHRGKPTFNPGLSENTARLAWLRSTGRCFHCYQRYTPNHQCPDLQGNQERPFAQAAMVRALSLPAVAPVPSDQMNSEMPVQKSVKQLLTVLNRSLPVTTDLEWRHDPAVSYPPLLQCALLSEQQASIERKDTETVEAANSAASNQDQAILPAEFKKI